MDQDERIKAEYDRLMEIFLELDENRRTVADGLIREAAYLSVAMADLKERIQADGLVDRYQNGKDQFGYKESAALKSYNSLAKTYKGIEDMLLKITPVRRVGAPSPSEKWELQQNLKWIDENADEEYKKTPEYIQEVDEVIKQARAFMERI